MADHQIFVITQVIVGIRGTIIGLQPRNFDPGIYWLDFQSLGEWGDTPYGGCRRSS